VEIKLKKIAADLNNAVINKIKAWMKENGY